MHLSADKEVKRAAWNLATQPLAPEVAKLSTSVVICAYTLERWNFLVEAVGSVLQQTVSADEVIVVIDHNDELLARARAELRGVAVIQNTDIRGISGARNSGVAAACGDIIVFLDDDAVAAPDWLEHLLSGYADPHVLGVGGPAVPLWPGNKPRWFPEEFLWVIGCSHTGTPHERAFVRNFWGCNMSVRREVFRDVGNFRTDVGRLGAHPIGCEETELCIRITQHYSEGRLLHEPEARVWQHVTQVRTHPDYFFRRCYAEGLSKALITQTVGSSDGLSDERRYTLNVLPQGVMRGVKEALVGRDLSGLARAASIVVGFFLTAAGYLRGRLAAQFSQPNRAPLDATGIPFSAFRPALVTEVDLGKALPDLCSAEVLANYTKALILVRLQGQPLGFLEVDLGTHGLNASALADLIRERFDREIAAHLPAGWPSEPALTASGLEPLPDTQLKSTYDTAPLVSVVIATHNRTQSLATCLTSVSQQNYANFEVVVVDNAPKDAETYNFLQHNAWAFPLKYVREDIPGLAAAHNRGLREASGDIVAFTDDDVRVDRYWLSSLVAGFRAADNVGCVTGMIVTAEMETAPQAWIEQYGGFNKGFEIKAFNLTNHRPAHPLYPYAAGIFGSGANMAFSRQALEAIGHFDAALGAGSKGVSGDDLAAFFDVVTHGYTLVYQPAAIVHHWHRQDYEGLRRQVYGYGVGLTAFLTRAVISRPRHLLTITPLIPKAIAYALSPSSPKNAKKQADYPRELVLNELKGMMYGPLAYVRSRIHLRTLRKRADKQPPSSFYRAASVPKVTQ